MRLKRRQVEKYLTHLSFALETLSLDNFIRLWYGEVGGC